MNNLEKHLKQIRSHTYKTEFDEVISTINEFYDYTATRFTNGCDDMLVLNTSGENEGSCKIFSFAQLHKLNKEQTLNCFGKYYRDDVLKNPQASDHANIRAFIKHGWSKIQFDNAALKAKKQ